MGIGGWEIFVILFIVLLLFGGRKLPELAKSLGKGIYEFKRAAQGLSTQSDESEEEKKECCQSQDKCSK